MSAGPSSSATHRAVISLGSNLDPERMVPEAARLLATRLRLLAASSVWETAPVGRAGQPSFFNAAVLAETTLSPDDLKRGVLRPIEAELGRVRGPDRFAPRPIDLDLVLYDDLTQRLADGGLLPDPDLERYVHLALPVSEVLPDGSHPVSGERLADLAARLLEGPVASAPRRTDLALDLQPRTPREGTT